MMQEMEEEGDELIQKNIRAKAKENLDWGKSKVLNLLQKGEGTYWDSNRQGKRIVYSPIVNSSNPPLYIDQKRGIDEVQEEIEPRIEEGKELPEIAIGEPNSSIPDTPSEKRK